MTKTPMTAQEARAAAVEWLRAGGKPNEVIPFEYYYFNASLSCIEGKRPSGCAGVAMLYLMGREDQSIDELGAEIFGKAGFFYFGLASNPGMSNQHNAHEVADALERAEMNL